MWSIIFRSSDGGHEVVTLCDGQLTYLVALIYIYSDLFALP